MLYILYYLFLIVNVWLSFLHKKSGFLCVATLLFLLFLFSSNDATGHDHSLYKIGFENPDSELTFEISYGTIVKAIKDLGINSYNVFLAIIFVIGSTLQYYSIRKFTSIPHFILSLYFVFIFPQWATAIRFFLAISFAIFSIKFLFQGNRLFFVIGIILASTFHYSVVVFVLFAPFFSTTTILGLNREKHSTKLINFIVIFFVIAAVGIYFFSEKATYGVASSVLSLLIGEDSLDMDNKVSAYFETKTKLGSVIFVVIHIVNLLMAIRINAISRKNVFFNGLKCQKLAYGGVIVNKIMSISLPLVILNLVFGRLVALGSIINMISMSALLENKYKLPQNSYRALYRYYALSLVTWMIPAIFEINSISPNMIIDTANQYWKFE